MPSTAGSVMLRAASMLNDSSQLVYTNAVLLPYLNAALDEVEAELSVYEVNSLVTDSLVIDVDIDDDELGSMPSDFVDVISLMERTRDSDDDWREVTETVDINRNLTTATAIEQWSLRNVTIKINPPQSDREVLLNYIKGLTTAAGAATAVDIEVSRHLLALITARNTATDNGNSPTKGASFDRRITLANDRLVRRLQKGNQTVAGVRRQPYTGRNR